MPADVVALLDASSLDEPNVIAPVYTSMTSYGRWYEHNTAPPPVFSDLIAEVPTLIVNVWKSASRTV